MKWKFKVPRVEKQPEIPGGWTPLDTATAIRLGITVFAKVKNDEQMLDDAKREKIITETVDNALKRIGPDRMEIETLRENLVKSKAREEQLVSEQQNAVDLAKADLRMSLQKTHADEVNGLKDQIVKLEAREEQMISEQQKTVDLAKADLRMSLQKNHADEIHDLKEQNIKLEAREEQMVSEQQKTADAAVVEYQKKAQDENWSRIGQYEDALERQRKNDAQHIETLVEKNQRLELELKTAHETLQIKNVELQRINVNKFKGDVGEKFVREALQDQGLSVVDTSDGKHKIHYGDLLATKEELPPCTFDSSGVPLYQKAYTRCAIEVKNASSGATYVQDGLAKFKMIIMNSLLQHGRAECGAYVSLLRSVEQRPRQSIEVIESNNRFFTLLVLYGTLLQPVDASEVYIGVVSTIAAQNALEKCRTSWGKQIDWDHEQTRNKYRSLCLQAYDNTTQSLELCQKTEDHLNNATKAHRKHKHEIVAQLLQSVGNKRTIGETTPYEDAYNHVTASFSDAPLNASNPAKRLCPTKADVITVQKLLYDRQNT
jgi:hypothetical protein